jgi:hypothetical protein
VSAEGDTIDFYLSHTRSISAATMFFKKALRATAASHPPESITTDKNPTYRAAIERINAERTLEPPVQHRDVKYLNNVIEADHGKLVRLIKPTLGFKTMKSAYATLKGFEVMRMFRKGQFDAWYPDGGVMGEERLINRKFGIYGRDALPNILSSALTSRPFFLQQGRFQTSATTANSRSVEQKPHCTRKLALAMTRWRSRSA